MPLTPEDIVHYIRKNEEENRLAECMYYGALKGLCDAQGDLSKLDDIIHIERILRPFLIQWGLMARTLGRKGTRWAQLGTRLRKLEPHFAEFRKKTFLQTDFEDQESSLHIENLYAELGKTKYVGPTAISKILHLMNPEIFIMWDEKIRRLYGVVGSSSGYLEFLAKNKRLLETVFDDKGLKDLSLKFCNKTLAKLIDEFNWYITNKDHEPGTLETRRKLKLTIASFKKKTNDIK